MWTQKTSESTRNKKHVIILKNNKVHKIGSYPWDYILKKMKHCLWIRHLMHCVSYNRHEVFFFKFVLNTYRANVIILEGKHYHFNQKRLRKRNPQKLILFNKWNYFCKFNIFTTGRKKIQIQQHNELRDIKLCIVQLLVAIE